MLLLNFLSSLITQNQLKRHPLMTCNGWILTCGSWGRSPRAPRYRCGLGPNPYSRKEDFYQLSRQTIFKGSQVDNYAKKVLKEQKMFPHVKRGDLLSAALMSTTEESLSKNGQSSHQRCFDLPNKQNARFCAGTSNDISVQCQKLGFIYFKRT